MSLHAQLSPEALERLHAQRRNSTISSIAIAVLSLVLIGLILGLFLLDIIVEETPTIVTYTTDTPSENSIEKPKPKVTTQAKPSSASTSVSKVITSSISAPTSVPVPDIAVSAPSVDFGSSTDFGSGWGDDSMGSSAFAGLPATIQKRCTESDRLKRLSETGGNKKCEESVKKSLQWIKSTQNEDGSWGTEHRAAMTGFSILAYLGHCEHPNSPEYGASITKGITYLINLSMANDGKIFTKKGIPLVYEHAIATYALAEAQTFCSQMNIKFPKLESTTKKAGEIIIDGQADSGSWIYNYANSPNNGDNSVGFWQIQALKACKHTGLFNETKLKSVAKKALEFLTKVQGENGAVGYRTSPTASPALTGGAVLAFQMWDQGNSPQAKKGLEYISTINEFVWVKADLYYHYYYAQALINEGGKEWTKYNKSFRDPLLNAQEKDGSWIPIRIGHGPKNKLEDLHMTTCLATFMLEVYYRFLPGSAK